MPLNDIALSSNNSFLLENSAIMVTIYVSWSTISYKLTPIINSLRRISTSLEDALEFPLDLYNRVWVIFWSYYRSTTSVLDNRQSFFFIVSILLNDCLFYRKLVNRCICRGDIRFHLSWIRLSTGDHTEAALDTNLKHPDDWFI